MSFRVVALLLLFLPIKLLGGEKSDLKTLIKALDDANAIPRIDALRSLGALGPKATPALPRVLELFHDVNFEVRLTAAETLGCIGPVAVPALLEKLAAKEKDTRYLSAFAFSVMGPPGEKAIPALVELTTDKEWEVRHKAIYAIGRMAPASEKAIPVMARLLGDENIDVAEEAFNALLRLEAKSLIPVSDALKHPNFRMRAHGLRLLAHRQAANPNEVLALHVEGLNNPHIDVKETILIRLKDVPRVPLPALLACLTDVNASARTHAAAAILQQEELPKAREALERALLDSHEPVQNLAAEGLSRLKVDVNALCVKHLEAKEAPVRFHAARFLFRRDPNFGPAIQVHEQLIKTGKNPERKAAAYLLGRTKLPVGKPAIPVIAEDLAAKEPEVVRDAAFVLYYLIPLDPDPVLPYFARITKHPHDGVREAVGFCLGRFEKKVWPLVQEMAKDGNSEVRRLLYQGLGENGGHLPETLPFLIDRALNDPSEHARAGALHGLEFFSAKTVAPHYHKMYKKAGDKERQTIIQCTGRFGVSAGQAMPLLIDALKDSIPYTRELAANILRQLGPEARPALPALQALLKDADGDVRSAAAAAIAAIGK